MTHVFVTQLASGGIRMLAVVACAYDTSVYGKIQQNLSAQESGKTVCMSVFHDATVY